MICWIFSSAIDLTFPSKKVQPEGPTFIQGLLFIIYKDKRKHKCVSSFNTEIVNIGSYYTVGQ